MFYLNGNPLPPQVQVFKYARTGFYAAASFMSFQECRFNFGASPYKYPPAGVEFRSFNDHGQLDDEQRRIYPKFQRHNLIEFNTKENSCILCYDQSASICLLPCKHDEFCRLCSLQLEFCPLCKTKIEELTEITKMSETES